MKQKGFEEHLDDLLEKQLESKENIPSEEDEEMLSEIIENMSEYGMLPYETIGISNDAIEWIYSQGHFFYQNGKYDEAISIFSLLMTFNPLEAKYYFALASCYHMKENYGKAIELYTQSAMLSPDYPLAFYYIANCYTKLNDWFWTIISLETLLTLIEDKPQYSMIKQRAEMNLEKMKKQVKEKQGINL